MVVADVEDEPRDSGPASDIQRILAVSPLATGERKSRVCRELLFCLATSLVPVKVKVGFWSPHKIHPCVQVIPLYPGRSEPVNLELCLNSG